MGGSPAIRFIDAPYSTAWSASPSMDAQWRDYSYDFRLASQPQEVGLYFYLSGNGTLDLQRLKLVQLSDQDLIDEIKAKYPDAGAGEPGAASRASRWACRAAGRSTVTTPTATRCRWTATRGVLGPGGAPALRIAAPEGILVYSAPLCGALELQSPMSSVSTSAATGTASSSWPGARGSGVATGP